MTLDAKEFIRRSLIHVLPDGFHRIRYFGFLSNRHRTHPPAEPAADYCARYEALTGHSLRERPHFDTGIMMADWVHRAGQDLPLGSGHPMNPSRAIELHKAEPPARPGWARLSSAHRRRADAQLEGKAQPPPTARQPDERPEWRRRVEWKAPIPCTTRRFSAIERP